MLLLVVFELLRRVTGSSFCFFRFKLSGLFCLSSCFKLLLVV